MSSLRIFSSLIAVTTFVSACGSDAGGAADSGSSTTTSTPGTTDTTTATGGTTTPDDASTSESGGTTSPEDTSGSDGTTAGADTSSTGAGEPEMVTLSNTSPAESCGDLDSVWAAVPQESNHLMATKLTPPAYPFTVDAVGYDLDLSLPQCQDNDHDVLILVSSAATPGATPSTDMTLVDTVHVSVEPGLIGAIEVELTAPIVLEQDEVLYVAIQMAVQGDTSLCLSACAEAQAVAGIDFWSGAATEPYPWIEWTEYVGPVNNLTTRAFGHGD